MPQAKYNEVRIMHVSNTTNRLPWGMLQRTEANYSAVWRGLANSRLYLRSTGVRLVIMAGDVFALDILNNIKIKKSFCLL